MPKVQAGDGTWISYREWGDRSAEPFVMIQGLGADSRGWFRQRGAFGRRFRCIAVDNRGVGGSDAPPGPYDLEVMAADVVAVLDHLGIGSAHVMGASMGGVISQVLAVRHAERVRSLVLACTGCRHLEWRRELLDEWAAVARSQGMDAFVRRNLRWLVGNRSLRRFAPVLHLFGPVAVNAPVHAFVAQVHAILDLSDDLRHLLGGVRVPTLVIVGSQDILTPLADSEEIAARIPDAELAVVRGAAHGFMVEAAGLFNRTVLEFHDRIAEREEEAIDLALRPVPGLSLA